MSTEQFPTKSELLARIQQGWDDFQTFLSSLSETHLITSTDAAGWTAKDHIMHLVVWEDGVEALLNRQSRLDRMGIDEATWAGHDYDQINAIIQQQHRDKPLAEVLQTFRDVHQRLIATIQSLSDDDLLRPYSDYQPGTDIPDPVIERIMGNTYEHYEEHTPWIKALVEK
jgi:hypothetical protein